MPKPERVESKQRRGSIGTALADWQLSNRAPPGGLVGRMITWPPGFEYPAHSTPTLDLGVIVSGRLELILDTGSTILDPGDERYDALPARIARASAAKRRDAR